jgi:hypothetical protein
MTNTVRGVVYLYIYMLYVDAHVHTGLWSAPGESHIMSGQVPPSQSMELVHDSHG